MGLPGHCSDAHELDLVWLNVGEPDLDRLIPESIVNGFRFEDGGVQHMSRNHSKRVRRRSFVAPLNFISQACNCRSFKLRTSADSPEKHRPKQRDSHDIRVAEVCEVSAERAENCSQGLQHWVGIM